MTSFIQKKLSLSKSLPEIIKEERLRNKLNLEELSFKIQVSLKYLEALEKGDYHLLPGEVYAKQFIKKLSKIFHLNEKTLFNIYQKEKQTQLPLLKLNEIIKNGKVTDSWFSPKTIRYGFIILILVAFISYLGWEVKNIFTPPFLEISSPLSQTITTNTSIEIKGKAEPETTVLINQQEILPEPDGSFSQTVDLTIGLNVFKISASKKHSKPKTITLSILRQPVTVREVNLEKNAISFK